MNLSIYVLKIDLDSLSWDSPYINLVNNMMPYVLCQVDRGYADF